MVKVSSVRVAKLAPSLNFNTLNPHSSLFRRFCNSTKVSPLNQIIHYLQTTPESNWNPENLKQLLNPNSNETPSPPFHPNDVKHITHQLGSAKGYTFFEFIRRHIEDDRLASRALQAVLEKAGEEFDKNYARDVLVRVHEMVKNGDVKLSGLNVDAIGRSFKKAGLVDELFDLYGEIENSLRSTRFCNHVIDGLFARGRMGDARKVLDEMLDRNGVPNQYTVDTVFGWVLRSDGCWKYFVEERSVVDVVKEFGKCGVFVNSFKMNKLIGKLCKSGKMVVGRDVVYEILRMGGCVEAATCNVLLAAMDRKGMLQGVNGLMHLMKEKEIQPNVMTYGIIINHLCKARRVDQALEVFDKLKNDGNGAEFSVKPDAIIYNTLIDGLCKVGRVDEGCNLMNNMKSDCECSPTTSTYNCLIDGFCKIGEIDRGLELFERMKVDGVSPNVITLNTMVDGMCRHERIGSAMEFLNEMQQSGVNADTVTYTTLITSFCNVSNVEAASRLFDEMMNSGCKADAVVYHAFLCGLTLSGHITEASAVASKMKEAGFPLDLKSYNVLIGGFCKKKKLDKAYETLHEMEKAGVKPDSVTYNTLITYFSKLGDFETTQRILSKMTEDGLVPNVITCGALIHAYCECGQLDEAMKIFKHMGSSSKVQPNTVIYNILIDSHCKTHNVETAMSLMNEMRVKHLQPKTNTYNSLFKVFMEERLLEKALNLMDQMIDDRCNPDYITIEILADWLSCAGESSRVARFVEAFAAPVSTR